MRVLNLGRDGWCLSTTCPVGSSSRPESGLGPLPGPILDPRSHNVCYVKLPMGRECPFGLPAPALARPSFSRCLTPSMVTPAS
jgi:hypothetical protein